MNLALESFADNPIIDELVSWPPRPQRIVSIRACNTLFRKPFIEVVLQDGETFHRHFERNAFSQHWAEACVILDAITSIDLISDFDFAPLAKPEALRQKVLQCRDECIEESTEMYREGMYEQFLMQFGPDCKNLPSDTIENINVARRQLGITE